MFMISWLQWKLHFKKKKRTKDAACRTFKIALMWTVMWGCKGKSFLFTFVMLERCIFLFGTPHIVFYCSVLPAATYCSALQTELQHTTVCVEAWNVLLRYFCPDTLSDSFLFVFLQSSLGSSVTSSFQTASSYAPFSRMQTYSGFNSGPLMPQQFGAVGMHVLFALFCF